MNSSLGVNCFLSSFQAAARSLARPSSVQSLAALPSARCLYSTWHAAPPRRRSKATGLSPVLALSRLPQWQPPSLPRRIGLRTFKVLPGHVVFTHYADLPPNYKDEVGLDFRRTDLNDKEVVQVFGKGMNAAAANRLLRILHGRRVAGTLEDPELRRNTSSFSREQQKTALTWLRRNVMVDEIANAGLRAEDELRALEALETGDESFEHGQEDARNKTLDYTNRLKIYKESEPEAPVADSIYGKGAFDKIRARNQAKWEAEQKRREQERQKREEEEALKNPGGLQTIDPNQPRQPSVRMQQYLEQGTDLHELPEMTRWERLLPSAIFASLVVSIFVAYAMYYRPPEPYQRLYPDVSPAVATIGVLIGLNILGWVLWKVPPLWPVLNRYFVVSPGMPRPVSLIAAMFSHQNVGHLVNNCFWLWVVGVRFHEDVGRGNFLATYFAAGSLGFLGSLTYYVLRGQFNIATLGLSGAGYGIMTAFFWLHRYDGFKILGLPPDPYNGVQGLGFIGLMLALNLSAFMSRAPKAMMLDIISHLTGMATGVAAAYLLEKRKAEQKEASKTAALLQAKEARPGLVDDLTDEVLARRK